MQIGKTSSVKRHDHIYYHNEINMFLLCCAFSNEEGAEVRNK